MANKVVVTGMGVVSPLGNTVPQMWEALCAGRSGIRAITRFDTTGYASRIAGEVGDVLPRGMTSKDLHRQDRFTTLAIEAADQAWAQSGLDTSREDPYRCGVYIGSGIGGIETIAHDVVRLHEGGPRRVSPLMIPKGLVNMASGNIAIRFGLRGPNKSIVTACATSTHCIGDAAAVIRLGEADVMIAGGSEASVVPFGLAGFSAMKALSTRNEEPERASRPFDADRDGFVIAEGAGLMVLESEAHARARGAEILGVVAGLGESCDAYHITAPRPDGEAAVAAMRKSLDAAQVSPDQVDYYNAHGTSTKYNDASETLALKKVFGTKTPPVSSTKSMMGHLLGAAGAMEAIICILAIRDGVLPPNINYETPDPECDVNVVANEARTGRVAIAMSNSLGFGGHNAAIVLTTYD